MNKMFLNMYECQNVIRRTDSELLDSRKNVWNFRFTEWRNSFGSKNIDNAMLAKKAMIKMTTLTSISQKGKSLNISIIK